MVKDLVLDLPRSLAVQRILDFGMKTSKTVLESMLWPMATPTQGCSFETRMMDLALLRCRMETSTLDSGKKDCLKGLELNTRKTATSIPVNSRKENLKASVDLFTCRLSTKETGKTASRMESDSQLLATNKEPI